VVRQPPRSLPRGCGSAPRLFPLPWPGASRQWSDLAIARTTPALLGLFSLITLWAAEAKVAAVLHPRSAACYVKDELTFSDAIASVRRLLWNVPNLSTSRKSPDTVEIPRTLLQRLTEALCYAT
jgi:hypothetical protein